MGEFAIPAGRPDGTVREMTVVNRHATLLRLGLSGAKTGFLHEAQRTAAVRRDDTVAVVLHARSLEERNRWLADLLGD